MAGNSEIDTKVASLCSDISDKAKNVIDVMLPQKIVVLNELCKNLPVLNIPIETFRNSIDLSIDDKLLPPGKRQKLEIGEKTIRSASLFPSNQTIVSLIPQLKKELYEFTENASSLKLWVQLNVPRIEDGNNFGVIVQERLIAEIARAEGNTFGVLEGFTNYFNTRAKLVTKMLKWPGVEDHRQSILDYDEKEYTYLKLVVSDLRNEYILLYDLLKKNRSKIEKPRNSHSEQMY